MLDERPQLEVPNQNEILLWHISQDTQILSAENLSKEDIKDIDKCIARLERVKIAIGGKDD